MNDIKERLGLDKTPYFTILQKFVSRIPSFLFNIILSRTLKLFYSHGENVSITAIDTTGLRVPIQVIIIPAEQGSYEKAS